MAELGSGSGSGYPASIDTDSTLESAVTAVRFAVPNDLAAAIIAIQTELGTDPAGNLSDVVTYLQTQHGTDGTHDASVVAMLAGAQTFTGAKTHTLGTITTNQPIVNGTETWNDGSVTFYGIFVNITTTAHASGSKLIALQDGGTNRFDVSHDGSTTITQGTITTDLNALKITGTWNEASTVFTALEMDITNTTSAATSKLLDLQVGSTSKFTVDKSGNLINGINNIIPIVYYMS